MSVYWKLTDEEAEELSAFFLELYKREFKRRGGRQNEEKALSYYASLEMRVRAQKRSAEPGHLHDCPVTVSLDDEQYSRLCALQAVMGCKSPEAVLEMAIGVGSKRLIDDRLRRMELTYSEELTNGKE